MELEWKKIIKKNASVLIKPNFCTNYADGVTTRLEFLEKIINIVKERTDNVFIGETATTYKDINKLKEDFPLDCEFLNLSEEETVVYKGLNLPRIALESVIINVPVLKAHFLTGLTIGIKNLFGFIQDKNKAKYHNDIDATILKVLEVIKPEINILDGLYSMDRYGPTGGRIIKTDFIVTSTNVIDLDIVTCRLIGVDPIRIKHIHQAQQIYNVDARKHMEGRIDFDLPEIEDMKC